jgi:hypothetical protein
MSQSLWNRIYKYAIENRKRLMWKRRLHALCYGAGLPVLSRIKEG